MFHFTYSKATFKATQKELTSINTVYLCLREEAERKGKEMALLVAELQRMRNETQQQAVSQHFYS